MKNNKRGLHGVTTVGWWLIFLSAGMTVAANLLLRAGVVRAGKFELDMDFLFRLVSQPQFDLGFLLYGGAAVVWFRVIATEPLSLAYPLLVSITFVMVTLGAVVLFQESINFRRVIGLAVIIVGIIIVGGE